MWGIVVPCADFGTLSFAGRLFERLEGWLSVTVNRQREVEKGIKDLVQLLHKITCHLFDDELPLIGASEPATAPAPAPVPLTTERGSIALSPGAGGGAGRESNASVGMGMSLPPPESVPTERELAEWRRNGGPWNVNVSEFVITFVVALDLLFLYLEVSGWVESRPLDDTFMAIFIVEMVE